MNNQFTSNTLPVLTLSSDDIDYFRWLKQLKFILYSEKCSLDLETLSQDADAHIEHDSIAEKLGAEILAKFDYLFTSSLSRESEEKLMRTYGDWEGKPVKFIKSLALHFNCAPKDQDTPAIQALCRAQHFFKWKQLGLEWLFNEMEEFYEFLNKNHKMELSDSIRIGMINEIIVGKYGDLVRSYKAVTNPIDWAFFRIMALGLWPQARV